MAKVEIGEIDFGTRRKYDLMKISRELFRVMMNNPKCDYATLEETGHSTPSLLYFKASAKTCTGKYLR